ncbi:Uncharacterised protein [Candidatus Burarchaeum australiense]|nr:Uncharacterised protein [Candidatus Burarchaeum australiense]
MHGSRMMLKAEGFSVGSDRTLHTNSGLKLPPEFSMKNARHRRAGWRVSGRTNNGGNDAHLSGAFPVQEPLNKQVTDLIGKLETPARDYRPLSETLQNDVVALLSNPLVSQKDFNRLTIAVLKFPTDISDAIIHAACKHISADLTRATSDHIIHGLNKRGGSLLGSLTEHAKENLLLYFLQHGAQFPSADQLSSGKI